MAEILLGKYQLKEILGTGSFGEVRKAKNLETNQDIAIKFEYFSKRNSSALFAESEALSQLQGGVGIPKLYAFGKQEKFDFMVTELLGQNLMDVFRDFHKKFSVATVGMIAVQLLERVEFIHTRGFLHRDIKPQNLLIGLTPKASLIHITDFGLSKRFFNLDFHMHIPYRSEVAFAGTMYFASYNTHQGIQQSRRDDVECLLHVLIYFLKGALPWHQTRNKAKTNLSAFKLTVAPERLCEGLPNCFCTALVYIRSLQFEERPDYSYLRNMFREIVQSGSEKTYFEWEIRDKIVNKRRSLSVAPQATPYAFQPSPRKAFRKRTLEYSKKTTESSCIYGHMTRRKLVCIQPVQLTSEISDEEEDMKTTRMKELPTLPRGLF